MPTVVQVVAPAAFSHSAFAPRRSVLGRTPAAVEMNILSNLFGGRGGDEEERGRGREPEDSSALARPEQTNKYFEALSNATAPELVQQFASTAPPEVQQAVRSTIMSMFGSLPPGQFETSIMSTSQNVASLMYSMMMTGYMFRNAEYRMSLKSSLEKTPLLPGETPGAVGTVAEAEATVPKVSGKVTVDLGIQKVEVDAAAYVADLHNEVAQLKASLAKAEKEKSEAALSRADQGELLAYMQQMPREQLQELTATVSPEVLECMQMLIEAVLSRDSDMPVAGNSIVAGTGMKMKELLVWQLITGYRLRELEQREELNKLLAKN